MKYPKNFINRKNICIFSKKLLFLIFFVLTSFSAWTAPPHTAVYEKSHKLHKVVSEGDYKKVKKLLAKGSHVNEKDSHGRTALHIASQKGDSRAVKLLIKHKVNVNEGDKHGWTALHIAGQNGHLEIIELLLGNEADVNARTTFGWTPLILASQNGHLQAVKLFVNKNANVNVRTYKGLRAQDYALRNEYIEVEQFLNQIITAETNFSASGKKYPIKGGNNQNSFCAVSFTKDI